MTICDDLRSGSYARAALESACSKVADAQRGGRNAVLNSEAFAMGQLTGAGVLNRVEAEGRLLAAAAACGLPRTEARSTIRSGLEAGKRQPRHFEDTGGVTPPAAKDARNSEYAQRIWLETQSAAGTLAERYLRTVCGLEPGDALEALGFHRGLYHSGAKQHLPAMAAPVCPRLQMARAA